MTRNQPSRLGEPLTNRENQIITALADGLTNKKIAEHLDITPLTVKSHLHRIGRKLGTGDRAGIVAAAVRSGLLDIAGTSGSAGIVQRPGRPVVCACKRCQQDLASGVGMAARIAGMRLRGSAV